MNTTDSRKPLIPKLRCRASEKSGLHGDGLTFQPCPEGVFDGKAPKLSCRRFRVEDLGFRV